MTSVTPQALLIGHSHVHAPMERIKILNLDQDVIAFWVEKNAIEWRADKPLFRSDLIERIAHKRPVFSFVGGSAHTVLGLFEHGRAFDFVLPEAPELPLDLSREIIPVQAVRASLLAHDTPFMAILELLVSLATGPVIHVGAPPPVYNISGLCDRLQLKRFRRRVPTFAPAWVRYKLWRLSMKIHEEQAKALGMGFVSAPKECHDSNGFLREDLQKDLAHANSHYGTLILNEIGLLKGTRQSG